MTSVATTLSWHSAKLPHDMPTRVLIDCHAGGRTEGEADGVGEDSGGDEGLLGLETLVVRGSGGRALLELPLVLHRLVLPVLTSLDQHSPLSRSTHLSRPALTSLVQH